MLCCVVCVLCPNGDRLLQPGWGRLFWDSTSAGLLLSTTTLTRQASFHSLFYLYTKVHTQQSITAIANNNKSYYWSSNTVSCLLQVHHSAELGHLVCASVGAVTHIQYVAEKCHQNIHYQNLYRSESFTENHIIHSLLNNYRRLCTLLKSVTDFRVHLVAWVQHEEEEEEEVGVMAMTGCHILCIRCCDPQGFQMDLLKRSKHPAGSLSYNILVMLLLISLFM